MCTECFLRTGNVLGTLEAFTHFSQPPQEVGYDYDHFRAEAQKCRVTYPRPYSQHVVWQSSNPGSLARVYTAGQAGFGAYGVCAYVRTPS